MGIFEDKNGQQLSYWDLEGDHMPILFVHGLGCAASSDYPEVANSSALRRHRRILVDLLGYGFSDKRDHVHFSITGQVDALEDLIEHLKIEKLVIFGHSMGGAIAIALADRIREKVHSIVISEGNLDSGGGPGSRRIASFSCDEYLEIGHSSTIMENLTGGNSTWAATMKVSNPLAVHINASDLVLGTTPTWRELLYSFKVPRTYIFGEKNLPDRDQEELKKNGIQVGTVRDAGHNMAYENPNGLAEEISKGIGIL